MGSPLKIWVTYRLAPFMAACLVKALRLTLKVRREGCEVVQDLVDKDQCIILTFWHRRLVLTHLAYPFKHRGSKEQKRGVAILSSDSKDGEFSAAAWRWFGIHAVRGTASDDGAKALVRMIRAVKEGWDFGITPDGPRGPRQVLKPGVIALARKTRGWVVPVCVAYSRFWELRTWDALLVPKPFSSVTVRYGKPFQVPEGSDEGVLGSNLERELNDMEA